MWSAQTNTHVERRMILFECMCVIQTTIWWHIINEGNQSGRRLYTICARAWTVGRRSAANTRNGNPFTWCAFSRQVNVCVDKCVILNARVLCWTLDECVCSHILTNKNTQTSRVPSYRKRWLACAHFATIYPKMLRFPNKKLFVFTHTNSTASRTTTRKC